MTIARLVQRRSLRKALLRHAVAYCVGVCLTGFPAFVVLAADHADTPFLIANDRPDARITGLHAFARGDDLVVAVSMNPAIPASATEFVFPSDLQIDINIDVNANVIADSTDLLGGEILDDDIMQEVRYRVTFDDEGEPRIRTIPEDGPDPTDVFVGLRDDPFIRTPRIGRNVASIVVEVPLEKLLEDQSTILVWATATLDDADLQELAGRAVRNQFGRVDANGNNENCLNLFHPKDHRFACGQEPDVIIYDTDFFASFPNGRELEDDVNHIANDQPIFFDPTETATENDVPFLAEFPYLAPPQLIDEDDDDDD